MDQGISTGIKGSTDAARANIEFAVLYVLLLQRNRDSEETESLEVLGIRFACRSVFRVWIFTQLDLAMSRYLNMDQRENIYSKDEHRSCCVFAVLYVLLFRETARGQRSLEVLGIRFACRSVFRVWIFTHIGILRSRYLIRDQRENRYSKGEHRICCVFAAFYFLLFRETEETEVMEVLEIRVACRRVFRGSIFTHLSPLRCTLQRILHPLS